MNLGRITRHSLVAAGVTVGIVVGDVAIRTAADLTMETLAASRTGTPAGLADLVARAASEEARSAALRAQLHGLTGGSRDLATLIAEATAIAEKDAAGAAETSADIAAARDALAAIPTSPPANPAPTRAPGPSTTRAVATSAPTAPAIAPHETDDGHDGGHDD